MDTLNKNRIRHLYDAMFKLEELREILRGSVPNDLTQEQKKSFDEILTQVKKILNQLEEGTPSQLKYITDKIELRTVEEEYINIQPIQPGGRLTVESRKAFISYGDGYSTCDFCRKPFRLDKITRPPIEEFHKELAEFVGMDVARVVPGARRGFQAVVSSIIEKRDSVILSSLAHYTEFLAVEDAGGIVKEVPLNQKNVVTAEATAQKIEEVKKETGKYPKLIMMDHFDYMLGNEHDVYGIGKIAKQYDIPFLYNGAYTIGIMPINGKKIGADFVVGSGHKSMASVAPSGVLAATSEMAEKVFRTTQMIGDVTKRKFGIKEVEMLGCTLMGATLLSMMASFPAIKERVKHWREEIEKSNYFINEFLRIRGNEVLSEYPRKHTLTKVDTTKSFDIIAQTHKKRGYFLTTELKKRGVIGVFPGATKQWKLNTYGLSWEQIKYLGDAFCDIARKYGIEVE